MLWPLVRLQDNWIMNNVSPSHLSSILQNYQMVDHVYMRMKEKPMCSFLSLHFYVARNKFKVCLYFSVNYK